MACRLLSNGLNPGMLILLQRQLKILDGYPMLRLHLLKARKEIKLTVLIYQREGPLGQGVFHAFIYCALLLLNWQ